MIALMTNFLRGKRPPGGVAAWRRESEGGTVMSHSITLREQTNDSAARWGHVPTKRQYDYERPSPSFSNTYDDVWELPAPKRYVEQPRGKPWANAGQNFPTPFESEPMTSNFIPSLFSKKVEVPRSINPFNPGMGPSIKPMKPIVHPMFKQNIGQRIVGSNNPNVRRRFNPNKVNKVRPQAPNKLNSYPLEERKNLISKATKSAPTNSAVEAKAPILRDDQIPTKQMTGRLELALGNIVKEIKDNNSDNVPFKALIGNTGYRRTMKQAIRERIRTAMIRQPVGPVVDIVKRYRKMYPKETDSEIVDLVLNTQRYKPVTVVESVTADQVIADDPEEFYKTNITPFIEKKMEEIFSNVQKMYTKAHRESSLAYTQAAIDANKIQPIEKKCATEVAEQADKIIKTLTGKQVTLEERDILNQYYTELIENILEEKIPEILPKCMKYCVKIFDLDHAYRAVKFMATKRVRDEMKEQRATARALTLQRKQEKNKELTENTNEVIDLDTSDEKQETDTKATEEKKEDTVIALDENEQQEEDIEAVDEKEEDVEALSEKEKNMEVLNEKEKNNDSSDPSCKNETEENDMQVVNNENTSVEEPIEVKDDSKKNATPVTPLPNKTTASLLTPKTPLTPSTPSSPASKDAPYYIKLLGRPTLPSRSVICNFLNSYNPTSIKKHKSIGNLLVVGFSNIEDYTKIIKANATTIGDTTILIKASEKVNTEKDNVLEKNGNDNQTEQETETQTSGNGVEDEITDLISTIKKSDEAIVGQKTSAVEVKGTVASQGTPGDAGKPFEAIREESENGVSQGSDQTVKESKANVKETGRSTPVRAARLANVTPSSIRTRRASRLIQE